MNFVNLFIMGIVILYVCYTTHVVLRNFRTSETFPINDAHTISINANNKRNNKQTNNNNELQIHCIIYNLKIFDMGHTRKWGKEIPCNLKSSAGQASEKFKHTYMFIFFIFFDSHIYIKLYFFAYHYIRHFILLYMVIISIVFIEFQRNSVLYCIILYLIIG